MHKEIGIDIGTMNMLVSTAEEGIIAREPTVVTVNRESDRLYSIGREAIDDYAASPDTLRLLRPLRDGLIADSAATRAMISYALHLTCGNLIIKPRVLMGIPFNLNEEEQGFLEWTALKAGARETFVVYSPVAALAGLDLPRDSAALIVDIGATFTSLMLVGGTKILYKNTVRVGGDSFDTAIMNYISHMHGIRINMRSAEVIKNKIGSVWINREDRCLDVKGKNAADEKMTARIYSHEMFDALEEPTAKLIAAVCDAISHIPSQYVGEVFHRGILLCGGGSRLDGLDKMISGVTGVGARVVEEPGDVVALGLGRILADLPTAMKNENTNISMRYLRSGV